MAALIAVPHVEERAAARNEPLIGKGRRVEGDELREGLGAGAGHARLARRGDDAGRALRDLLLLLDGCVSRGEAQVERGDGESQILGLRLGRPRFDLSWPHAREALPPRAIGGKLGVQAHFRPLGFLHDILGRIAVAGCKERQETERRDLEQRAAPITGRESLPPIRGKSRLDAPTGFSPTVHRVNLLRTLGAAALADTSYASLVTNCFPQAESASEGLANRWG